MYPLLTQVCVQGQDGSKGDKGSSGSPGNPGEPGLRGKDVSKSSADVTAMFSYKAKTQVCFLYSGFIQPNNSHGIL